MTDYTITTNFGAKDSLPSGNAAKVVKGSEFTTEFTNIAIAVNSKADKDGATFTGNITFDTDTLFVDASTDRVGIGTTNPVSALDVRGDISVGGSSASASQLGVLRSWLNTVDADIYAVMPSGSTTSGTIIEGRPNAHVVIGLKDNDNQDSFNVIGTGGTYSDSGSEADNAYDKNLFCVRGSGNVGIGTTNPQGNLHISAGTDGDATLILEADTDQGGSEADNPRIELRQDGHEVEGSIYMEGDPDQTANNSIVNSLILDSKNYSGNNYMQFATGGVTNPSSPSFSNVAMTITPDGHVLVGTTDTTLYSNNTSGAGSNGILLTSDGRIEAARYAATAASFNRMANDGATVNFYNRGILRGYINTNQSGTSLISTSDQRLKENVTDSGDAGSTIDAIQVRQFDWIANGKHQDYGFVAQELANAVPDAVFTGEDEDETMGVDYSKLVPILVKEVQALRSRVAQLEESE